MKTKPKIYVFSPEIPYKTFYKIWKLFPPEGITPEAMIKGRMIWEMVRDKQTLLYIDPTFEDNPIFCLKLPTNKQVYILK